MPLTQEQTNHVLREYNDFVSSRPDPSNDPVTYSKLDVRNAMAAVDARIDTVLSSILNQVPAGFPPAHRRKLVQLIIQQRVL